MPRAISSPSSCWVSAGGLEHGDAVTRQSGRAWTMRATASRSAAPSASRRRCPGLPARAARWPGARRARRPGGAGRAAAAASAPAAPPARCARAAGPRSSIATCSGMGEVVGKLGGGGVAVGRLGLQAAQGDLLVPLRQVGPAAAQRQRVGPQPPAEARGSRRHAEGQDAGGKLVEHHAQGEQVAARIGAQTEHLFRRDVGAGASGRSNSSPASPAAGRGAPGRSRAAPPCRPRGSARSPASGRSG